MDKVNLKNIAWKLRRRLPLSRFARMMQETCVFVGFSLAVPQGFQSLLNEDS